MSVNSTLSADSRARNKYDGGSGFSGKRPPYPGMRSPGDRMHDAMMRRGLTPNERLVLIALAYHDGPGRCRVKQTTLAKETELPLRNVQRAIAGLKSCGLIEVHRSRRTARTRVRYTWEADLRSATRGGSRSATGGGSKELAPQEESGSDAEAFGSNALPAGDAHLLGRLSGGGEASPPPPPPRQRQWPLVGEARHPQRWLTEDLIADSKGLARRVGPVPKLPTKRKEIDDDGL